MFIIDNVKNWRLKRRIPKNQKAGGKFRYAGDGVTKIPVDENEEVQKYNHAREQEKKKNEL